MGTSWHKPLSIIFLFLDGVGLGAADGSNPFWTFPAPFLRELLGSPLVRGIDVCRQVLIAHGIDAGLGIPGAPQSATGQIALFTGVNAPALVGEHLTAYPNARLREIIAERSILKRAVEDGHRGTFANAYSAGYWHMVERRRRRHSASTLTNMAAKLPFRDFDDLARGRAVYWDITHSTTAFRHGTRLPFRHPREAGQILAKLGSEHDLVLFESFLTDMIGHRRLPHTPRWAVYVLDAFLEGIVTALGPETSLVISSDHGNFEDVTSRMHTENLVPLIVIGPAAGRFSGASRITDIAPAILETLNRNQV